MSVRITVDLFFIYLFLCSFSYSCRYLVQMFSDVILNGTVTTDHNFTCIMAFFAAHFKSRQDKTSNIKHKTHNTDIGKQTQCNEFLLHFIASFDTSLWRLQLFHLPCIDSWDGRFCGGFIARYFFFALSHLDRGEFYVYSFFSIYLTINSSSYICGTFYAKCRMIDENIQINSFIHSLYSFISSSS